MNRNILKLIMILICGTNILMAQSKVGTTVANFLTIPVGPRATGMGGAFVAVANDATTAYWNPGGLSRLSSSEFSVVHSEWLVGTSLNWLGVAIKFDADNTLGLSVNQLAYGKEDITTVDQPNGTGQTWDAQDIAFSLSYARNLTDRFSIGGSVKYIQQRIYNESASAFALDIGLLFTTQLKGLRIGMNISNFGTEMQLSGKDLLQPVDIDPAHTGNNDNIVSDLGTDSWTLPLVFTVGLGMDAYETEDWKWTVATDAVYPNNQTSYLNAGTELTWSKIISLRVGYNSFLKGGGSLTKKATEEGLTAGLGLNYNFGPFSARVDYSYMDFGVFKQISKYSLSIGF
ncbi:MAG: PorV/PorQ family protein [Ignavibacteriales bacterium]